ncbi:hypothetical protein SCALM49S_03281 [Streptomyces californicus]
MPGRLSDMADRWRSAGVTVGRVRINHMAAGKAGTGGAADTTRQRACSGADMDDCRS